MMETCGFILSRGSDFESFLMRCCYCTTDLEIDQWHEFVLHFRSTHGANVKENVNEQDTENITEEDCIKDSDEVFIKEPEEELLNIPAEVNEEDIEIAKSPSSLSESSLSGTEEDAESVNSEKQEPEQLTSSLTSYKYNPSFFRRDTRTLKFIEAYRSYSCLWNSACSKFKDPSACKSAYQHLIAELDTKIGVLFSEHTLKAALKRLHIQYNIVEKRVKSGSLKPNSIAFNHYTSCEFLRANNENFSSLKNGSIELNFSKMNPLTTDFIKCYAKFPQLYDNNNSDFSRISCRKQAYEQIKAETIVPNANVDIDDVYLGIQYLRQWYYKRTKYAAKAANEAEKFYFKACDFLPPKMFKQKLNCEICDQETSSDHVLQAHMYKVHNVGELPFKCSSCERSFVGRGELAIHKQRFHIGKTYKCTYCPRSFAVNSDLQLHLRTHSANNILCELCGKAFRLRSQLKLHVTAIHTKIRAFKCTMCPKDFLKKVDLSDHIKSHLNIRDKICATCGKGFTSCHALIRHRQIHSEVKKFVCKLCNARFSQFVGLNSHMKRTHNIVRDNGQKSTENVSSE